MFKRVLNKLLNYKAEPVRVVSKLTVVSTGTFALASLWDIPVSDRLQDQILKSIAIAVPALLIGLEWVRSQVTPSEKAELAIDKAYAIEPGKGKAKPKLSEIRV